MVTAPEIATGTPVAEPLNAFERYPWNRPWLWYTVSVGVLAVEYFTSPYFLFPVFFVIPVLLVAWHARLSHALTLVAVLCLARISFHFHWGVDWGLQSVLINAAIRLAVLSLLAALTHRVSTQTRELRRRVRLLEGMLPICGFCKDIRDTSGDWIQLENYITRHTEAQFSTGICDDCAQKHFGPIYEKSRTGRA